MIRHSPITPALLVALLLGVPGIASGADLQGRQDQHRRRRRHRLPDGRPGTGRVFVSRGTHVMVVDGATGKVLGDIPDTPRVHGIALAPKSNHGFTTNGGDSTVTMFDMKTLAVMKKIPVKTGGLDGIMYDDFPIGSS